MAWQALDWGSLLNAEPETSTQRQQSLWWIRLSAYQAQTLCLTSKALCSLAEALWKVLLNFSLLATTPLFHVPWKYQGSSGLPPPLPQMLSIFIHWPSKTYSSLKVSRKHQCMCHLMVTATNYSVISVFIHVKHIICNKLIIKVNFTRKINIKAIK